MKKSKRTPLHRDMFVYFIQCGGDRGPVKIGYSRNVEQRVSDLQVASPYPLVVIGKFKSDNAEAFEASFHRLFADLHLRGEWFAWSPEFKRLVDGMNRVQEMTGDRVVNIRIERAKR